MVLRPTCKNMHAYPPDSSSVSMQNKTQGKQKNKHPNKEDLTSLQPSQTKNTMFVCNLILSTHYLSVKLCDYRLRGTL